MAPFVVKVGIEQMFGAFEKAVSARVLETMPQIHRAMAFALSGIDIEKEIRNQLVMHLHSMVQSAVKRALIEVEDKLACDIESVLYPEIKLAVTRTLSKG